MQMIDINLRPEDISKFHTYYDKSDACWNCNGQIDIGGYGKMRIGNDTLFMHRISYYVFKGNFDQNLLVLHKCDNPRCVNPDHLFLGTQRNNIDDKVQKERQAIGFNNGNSFLTRDEVIRIRQEFLTGLITKKRLSQKYKVHPSTIARVINRTLQSHIS